MLTHLRIPQSNGLTENIEHYLQHSTIPHLFFSLPNIEFCLEFYYALVEKCENFIPYHCHIKFNSIDVWVMCNSFLK